MDRLADESPEYEQVPLNFHLTSVYDYSLQEAFSRVIHKLIDSLPYLENLLNVFCAVSPRPFSPHLIYKPPFKNTSSPKAFLFDTTSKLYVATDASPVDQATHNLCCDYLQMLNSFGPLYKYGRYPVKCTTSLISENTPSGPTRRPNRFPRHLHHPPQQLIPRLTSSLRQIPLILPG